MVGSVVNWELISCSCHAATRPTLVLARLLLLHGSCSEYESVCVAYVRDYMLIIFYIIRVARSEKSSTSVDGTVLLLDLFAQVVSFSVGFVYCCKRRRAHPLSI